MIKKTLGGERLGSGRKMKVGIEGYGRSNHDLSKVVKTTMSPGTLVPVYTMVSTPGDTHDMNIRAKIQTNATVGSLYGSYIFGVDVFEIDMRLYIGGLQYNAQNLATNMQLMKIPQVYVTAKTDIPATDNGQIGSSCVLKYLGIKGIGEPGTGWGQELGREFNAIPLIGYYDIFRNYYANKQEDTCYMVHTPPIQNDPEDILITLDGFVVPNGTTAPHTLLKGTSGTITFTGGLNIDNIRIETETGYIPIRYMYLEVTGGNTSPITVGYLKEDTVITGYQLIKSAQTETPSLYPIAYEDLEKIRPILNSVPVGAGYLIDSTSTLSPYKELLARASDGSTSLLNSQEGLMVKTYQSDLLQNFIKTATVTALSAQTAISTSGLSFTIDTLNFSIKLNNLLQREAAAGGTLKDYIEVAYGVEMYAATQIPMYMGGYRDKIVFEEVTSTSATANEPLGQIAGKGRFLGAKKGGNITIKTKEWCYIMAIAHITPEIDYSQGNRWDTGLKTMNDIHKPALDEIGYQDLITEQMAYWDTTVNASSIVQKSMGKQPAWLNYMTDINETFGLFAEEDNMMFMTLNRRYEKDEDLKTIQDLTTYIDPVKFNYIFANTEISAQNFRVQIGFDIETRRKISAKIIPNL